MDKWTDSYSDVEKCQTEGFDWQNFIRTHKNLIFLLHILLFGLTRFPKLVQMTGMSKKDFNIFVIWCNYMLPLQYAAKI